MGKDPSSRTDNSLARTTKSWMALTRIRSRARPSFFIWSQLTVRTSREQQMNSPASLCQSMCYAPTHTRKWTQVVLAEAHRSSIVNDPQRSDRMSWQDRNGQIKLAG